jgi:hypothetical protein
MGNHVRFFFIASFFCLLPHMATAAVLHASVSPSDGKAYLRTCPELVEEVHEVAMCGDIIQLKMLLARYPFLVNARDKGGHTPLHRASVWGDLETAVFLIRKGADVDARSDDGMTPLHCAMVRGCAHMVKLLVEKGADMGIEFPYTCFHECYRGETPFHIIFSYFQKRGIRPHYDPEWKISNTQSLKKIYYGSMLSAYRPVGSLQEEQSYKNYTVRVYLARDEGSFEVLKDNRRMYARRGVHFYIGGFSRWCVENHPALPLGKCITGDGRAFAVIAEWFPAWHGDYTTYVFEIDREFRLRGSMFTRDVPGSFSEHKGKYYYHTCDGTFRYWHACYGASPFTRVVLRYVKGSFHLADDLMVTLPLSKATLAEHAKKVALEEKEKFQSARESMGRQQLSTSTPVDRDKKAAAEKKYFMDSEPPSLLWKYMLESIYSGNAPQAWKLLDMAWNSKRAGKEAFLKEFREKLSESPYWADLNPDYSRRRLAEA